MSPSKASTPAAVLKRDLPKPMASTGPAKSAACIGTKVAVCTGKDKQKIRVVSKFSKLLLCSLPTKRTLDPFGGRIYKYSCHTCNVHFLTIEGFEEHILKGSAHKPFKLSKDTAEELGYLNASEELDIANLDYDNLGRPNESSISKSFSRRLPHTSGFDLCNELNCTCPRFEFTPSQQIVVSPSRGLRAFTFLDGAAGSTLYAHEPDEDGDPGNIKLSFEQPLSTIVLDNDELYVPPPDSDEEEVLRPPAATKIERTRAQQDQFEMRKRFAKGKNRKAARQLRKEEKFTASQAFVKPVIEAYVATDEKLFGQKRFEEIDDEARANAKKAQQQAVDSWQQEVGLLGTYVTSEGKAADQLAEDIDCFIRDILFELDMQAEEEKRKKASGRYKDKLFFEDTIEDIAIDHEFRLADQGQERLRQDIGKKQNKKLRGIEMEDIVDDIAMDHSQEVGEMEEEHRRKNVGRIQNKSLTSARMGNMIGGLAMDHLQEVGEKEQEQYRRVMGRAQGRKLMDANMLSHIDDFVMDHSHEVGEKEQEHHRKSFGMKQTKEFMSGKEVDLVNSLIMNHLQEADEKVQEHHRKTSRIKQTKQPRAVKDANLADSFAMDHIQDAGKKREHSRESTRKHQRRNLAADNTDNMVSSLAMKEHREQKKRAGNWLEKGILTGKPDETVNSVEESSQPTVANKKSNTFSEKYLTIREENKTKQGDINAKNNYERDWAGEKDEGVRHEQAGEVTQENWAIPEMLLDPVGANVDHEIEKPTHDIHSMKTKFEDKHITLTAEAEAENSNLSYDDDGYSIPAPAPKKDRRQLRKEANAKFEAMMEEMVRAQEEQNRV